MSHVPPSPRRLASRPIPRPRKLELRLDPRDAEQLQAIAERAGTTVDVLAAQVLVDYVHRQRSLGAATRPRS